MRSLVGLSLLFLTGCPELVIRFVGGGDKGDTGGGDEYADLDGDGWSEADGDCDDENASTYPGAPEGSDGVDNDCDGEVDERDTGFFPGDDTGRDTGRDTGATLLDADGDGYSVADGDCDDANAWTYPGAKEIKDGIDNDCDSLVDEGGGGGWFDDLDGDGYTTTDGDCDDADPSINPGAIEIVDKIDNDCDGAVDEGGGGFGDWKYDDDADGYSELDGDCNDADASIYPGAKDRPGDKVDSDCDGLD
jgi:hypothetical protein